MWRTSTPEDHARDEAAIRALEAAYDASWNAGDVRSLVAAFAPEAVVVNPLGQVARGQAEIERVMHAFLSGPARGSTHNSTVFRVEFVTDDVAVVDGEATLERLAGPDGAPSPPLVHRFTDVVVRQDDAWLLAQVRAYVLMPAPAL